MQRIRLTDERHKKIHKKKVFASPVIWSHFKIHHLLSPSELSSELPSGPDGFQFTFLGDDGADVDTVENEYSDARLKHLKKQYGSTIRSIREQIQAPDNVRVDDYFEQLYSCVNTVDRIVAEHPGLVHGPLNETSYLKSSGF